MFLSSMGPTSDERCAPRHIHGSVSIPRDRKAADWTIIWKGRQIDDTEALGHCWNTGHPSRGADRERADSSPAMDSGIDGVRQYLVSNLKYWTYCLDRKYHWETMRARGRQSIISDGAGGAFLP